MKLSPWAEYKANEELNAHSENLVLMAKHVGDSLDQQRAQHVVWRVQRMGHLDELGACDAAALNTKMWPKFRRRYRKV
jgi:hypothetical protein